MSKILATHLFLLINSCCFAFNRDTVRSVIHSTIDGVRYQAVYYSSHTLIIKKANGKPVLTFKGDNPDLDIAGFDKFYFTDFNSDGFKDIRITYFSNVPGVDVLLLYDKHTRTFKMLKDFIQFPSALRLPHTRYYYSYHRSGCADMNWDSDLFKIVNFKAIRLGNIKGLECGGKEGIFITKAKGEILKAHKQFTISTISHYKNYKWGFIRNYWLHYYKEFISGGN